MTLYTTLQSIESHPYSAIPTQQFGEAGGSLHSSSASPASSSSPSKAVVRNSAAEQVRTGLWESISWWGMVQGDHWC